MFREPKMKGPESEDTLQEMRQKLGKFHEEIEAALAHKKGSGEFGMNEWKFDYDDLEKTEVAKLEISRLEELASGFHYNRVGKLIISLKDDGLELSTEITNEDEISPEELSKIADGAKIMLAKKGLKVL